MDQSQSASANSLAQDEKLTPVMAYTTNMLVRGNVITKESTRVSVWLRTQSAPEYLRIQNAQILLWSGNGPVQSLAFSEYFLPAVQVLAFHMVPPARDPVDYDETEKNRMMKPLTFLVGTFRMQASVRMSTNSDLSTYFSVVKTPFISIYEMHISNPSLPSMGTLHVPMGLVRPAQVTFGFR